MQVDYKQLEFWLHDKLKPLCVADPIPLSQYVIALIKKDKSEQELKEICIDQLEVFLQENTSIFVKDLFLALKSKSYINNEATTKVIDRLPSSESTETLNKDRKRQLSNKNSTDNDSMVSKQRRKHSPESRNNKSTSYSHSSTSRSPTSSKRYPSKEYQSNGPNGNNRHLDNSKRKCIQVDEGLSNNHEFHSDLSDHRSKHHDTESHRRDNREPHHAHDTGDNTNRVNKHSLKQLHDKRSYDSKRQCRSFEEHGFCMYGNKCFYDHGPNTLVISPSKAASVAITQLASSLINANSLVTNSSTSSGQVNRSSPVRSQPRSIVAAVIPNTSLFNSDISSVGAPIVPIYTPTPIPSYHDNNELLSHLIDDYDNSQQMSWKHRQGRSNHRSANMVSKNIIPIPRTENFKHKMSSSMIIPPPAYEPDHPHISMISSSCKAQPEQVIDGDNKESITTVTTTTTNNSNTDSTAPNAYTPSPISLQTVKEFNQNDEPDSNVVTEHAAVPGESGTTLYISNIPVSFNQVTKLHEHFSQFGNVVDIVTRYMGSNNSAMIKFSTPDEAFRAYRSPKAIFSNRFIRVSRWFNRDKFGFSSKNQSSRPRNVLDRLGRKPRYLLYNNNNNNRTPGNVVVLNGQNENANHNKYAWLSQCTEEDDSKPDTSHQQKAGNRSRWRLERNSEETNEEEEEEVNEEEEEGVVHGSLETKNQSPNNNNTTTKQINTNENNFFYSNYRKLSEHPNFKLSHVTDNNNAKDSSYKSEKSALAWERRKIIALRQRKEQMALLEKSREARESTIASHKQRLNVLTIKLREVMGRLERKKKNQEDGEDHQEQELSAEEKQNLLAEAKSLYAKLEVALLEQKKVVEHENNKKGGENDKSPATISALQALPASVRQERENKIAAIKTELDELQRAVKKSVEVGSDVTEQRKLIVKLKRQLVDLETVRPADLDNCGTTDSNLGFPYRSQTKLDKRPRTLFVSGLEPNDADNFLRALSLNYLHTQNSVKHIDESGRLVFEITFCTRDFAETAIRHFTQFHGHDIQMNFNHPKISTNTNTNTSTTVSNNNNDDDTATTTITTKEIDKDIQLTPSIQANSMEQNQLVSSTESV